VTHVLDYVAPSPDMLHRLLAPARLWFAPEFHGLDDLDLRRPALLVGNHTLYGLTDVPLLVEHLYVHHGLMLRSLGDRGHLRVPLWGDLLCRYGMVEGTPENCRALMRSGQSVLVFPGGAREVTRRRGERYRLIWKKRTGFARLAIEHGYDIIPFASVGADDNFRILFDADDVLASARLRAAFARVGLLDATRGGDAFPPFVVGLGPTFVPRPQKFYFGFGPRISTGHLTGLADQAAAAWQLREEVARAIEEQIAQMLSRRAHDRPRTWSPLRRFLAPIPRGPLP
jgi:1-acyl-sn-glycerol-3-phosphate acyltransferase